MVHGGGLRTRRMTALSASMFSPIEVPASMRIIGEWLACNDGVTRPAVRAKVRAAAGSFRRGEFLIDSAPTARSSGPPS